jgi:acyl dehydratase
MPKLIEAAELSSFVSKEIGTSEWITINQERVNSFAELSGDHQWIHVEVARAQREIGGTIVHGFLLIALMPMMMSQTMRLKNLDRSINYGFTRLNFLRPVRVGSSVRTRAKLISVEPLGDGTAITRRCAIEVRGETHPAVVADWVTVAYMGQSEGPGSMAVGKGWNQEGDRGNQ